MALLLVAIGVRAESPQPSTTQRPLFADDFDGPAGSAPGPLWAEWSSCTYNATAAYGNIRCGQRAVLDGQGHLEIPATADTGTSISTGGHFSFLYGTASAWVKVPPAVGYWPAFWTLNSDPAGSPDRPNGEIDVLETYTTFPGVYRRAVHNWNGGAAGWSSSEDPLCGHADLSGAFHKYTARVEPDRITFFFDDVQCGESVLRSEQPGKPWQFGPDSTAANWLLLTLAIGGAGGQQKPVTEPGTMLVDRVEVLPL